MRIGTFIARGGMVALAGLLTACGSMHAQRSQHEGLDRASYGARVVTRTPPNGNAFIRSCSPSAQDAEASEGSRRLTAMIMSPLSGLAKVDRSILSEELQGNFLMPGDSGGSTVAILDRGPGGIVFWHIADLVSLDEVTDAARQFCRRDGHAALYLGSARKCQPIKLPVRINGSSSDMSTFAISEFRCN